MKIYEFSHGRWRTFLGLGGFTLLLLYIPVAQFVSGRVVQWEALWAMPILAVMWYTHLKPVTRITLGDGRITFTNAFGEQRVAVSDLKIVRPWVNLSKRNFIIEFRGGYAVINDAPSAVAVLVRDLKQESPELVARGVPPAPGEARDGV